MIKKYIRGHSTRGDEVIKELEKLGGVNKYGFVCVFPSEFYIIDHTDNNCIKGVSRGYVKELIEQTFEEIKLPEEFKPEEFVIVTEKETNRCNGCMFENLSYGNCLIIEENFKIGCKKKGIIYKLKE